MKGHDYVVITSSRTGSTWLIDSLDQVPGVGSYGELFLPHGRRGPAIATRADYPRFCESHYSGSLRRPFSVWTYLDELYQRPHQIGFKLMYSHLRAFPEVLPFFAFHRIRVLHLVRHNLLDVVISDELAKATGQSHQSGTQTEPPAVYLDPVTIAHQLRMRERSVKYARWAIRLSTCRCIEIVYENLTAEPLEFKRIKDFLRIDADLAATASRLSKRGSQEHSRTIVNYDEVRQRLSRTRFSDMVR
jgi:LPS sulfotransferase NodH